MVSNKRSPTPTKIKQSSPLYLNLNKVLGIKKLGKSKNTIVIPYLQDAYPTF